jgi:hypothetical protein
MPPALHAGLSRELNFTMPKEPKLANLPFTMAVTADTGVNVATAGNVRGGPLDCCCCCCCCCYCCSSIAPSFSLR